MSDRRTILLGMNNPLSQDPEYALYPAPVGCTGWRIWQLLRRRVPDVTQFQYVRAFDRRNLVTGEWTPRAARAAAIDFTLAARGRNVVVLGAAAAGALGLPMLLIHPQEIGGVTWRQLPHPSGRNRWYNEEANCDLAAMLLESLYREYVSWRCQT